MISVEEEWVENRNQTLEDFKEKGPKIIEDDNASYQSKRLITKIRFIKNYLISSQSFLLPIAPDMNS